MNSRFLTFLILSLIASSVVFAQDSIPVATDLQEVVVKSKRSWVKDGVYNFIPTKKEKQLANSPGSLIDVMNIPFLQANNDVITTRTGEGVTVFINGMPADDVDLSTFWPKNVKKVEFLKNPTDPKFRGAVNVLNFIMPEYEAGGVTRLNARQEIPLTGRYEAASKLNYKRMTFGAKVDYFYWKNNKSIHSDYETTYRNIFYDGEKYDELKNISEGERKGHRRNLNAAINARYTSDHFTATHTLGLSWNESPGNFSSSVNEWSQPIFDSDLSSSFSRNRSLSPSITGDYYWKIAPKWSLTASWRYAYSANRSNSWSQYGNNPKIDNGVEETVNSLPFVVDLSYRPHPKWSFSLTVNPKSKWFSSSYSGSSDETQNQFREELAARVLAYWLPTNTFRIFARPGMVYNYTKVGEIVTKECKPTLEAGLSWNPDSRFMLTGNVNYFLYPVEASQTNPVMVKESDLMWITGNPALKPYSQWLASAQAYYAPLQILNFTAALNYTRSMNYSYYSYIAAPAEMGGVIKTPMVAPSVDGYTVTFTPALSLLDNKLALSCTPTFDYKKTRGYAARNFHVWWVDANVSYILGHVRIFATYRGRNKWIGDAGEYFGRRQARVMVGASYGWKNLYADFRVNDLFHTTKTDYTERYSDAQVATTTMRSVGRTFTLNLTYTFAYGKKVDRNIQVNALGETESSIYTK